MDFKSSNMDFIKFCVVLVDQFQRDDKLITTKRSSLSEFVSYIVTTEWSDWGWVGTQDLAVCSACFLDWCNIGPRWGYLLFLFLLPVSTALWVEGWQVHNSYLYVIICRTAEKKKKLWQEDLRWQHDRYDERSQAPKSREELIAIYGFDIRTTDGNFSNQQSRFNKPRLVAIVWKLFFYFFIKFVSIKGTGG